MPSHRFAVIMALLLCVAGCQQREAATSARPSAAAPPPVAVSNGAPKATGLGRVEAPHLPNPQRIHENVISGGLPEGDEAFAELAALGIRTVISVDGMKPDVEAARRHGMRYVHLPHGYDGIPEIRGQELAKAVRDLPGPFYIHCHHGKHRSPAAAAVACVGAGLIDPSSAVPFLTSAGTSDRYQGLYAAARNAQRFEAALLDALPAEFPETATLPPLAEAMVELERVHHRVNLIAAADWAAPANYPDLDPAHQALLLREQYTEMLRMDDLQQQPEAFRTLMADSESAALALEEALRSGDTSAAAAALGAVNSGCAECHRSFRD
ncbi:MAG: cytochrome c [Planctomyces sp.]|nr:cytochrome c [Planctomyces sp.]